MNRFFKILFSLCLVLFYSQAACAASPYYTEHDYFNSAPTQTTLLIPHFTTYQQTTDYSCSAVCVQMLEKHYNQTVHSEGQLIKQMSINPYIGVTPDKLYKYLVKTGWQVEKASNSNDILSYEKFAEFVTNNISNSTPILVESYLWGGHWQIIIGLDKLADGENDDVLILADPMDIADHKVDGYTVVNAKQFFYSWFDGNLGPNKRIRQWIIAKPK